MKLTSERLKEATRLLKDLEIDFSHKENVVFVDDSGFGRAVTPSTEFEPGQKGHFAVAPIVVAIIVTMETIEEEDEEYIEEDVSLIEYTSFEDIPEEDDVEFAAGAFVFPPTKDGSDYIQKPVTLHSNEELYKFMERWGMLEG